MYDIWVTVAGQELHRQTLTDGSWQLGRSSDNEIQVANGNISRHQLRLVISRSFVTVTDLGSTNGTWLAGRQLQAQQPVEWPPNSPLQIGALTLQLTPTSDVSTPDLTLHVIGRAHFLGISTLVNKNAPINDSLILFLNLKIPKHLLSEK